MFNQITPESKDAWRLRTTITKSAQRGKSGKVYIKPFDLKKEFSSEFLAVGITVNNSKDNWRNGGYLSQEFKFSASGYAANNKAFNRTQDLLINNVSIITLPLLSPNPYRLWFFAPTYFSQLRLQVWEYQGVTTNTLIADLGAFLAHTPAELLINLPEIHHKLDQIIFSQQSGISVDLSALDAKLDQLLKNPSLPDSNSLDISPPDSTSSSEQKFFLLQ